MRMGAEHSTSAAFAAAEPASPAPSSDREFLEEPRVLPREEEILEGMEALVGCDGGALSSLRPGWEKLSRDSFPQRLPILEVLLGGEMDGGDGRECWMMKTVGKVKFGCVSNFNGGL